MNKTINVNLAGYFFHVDEEAYRLLSAYLNQLRSAFDKTKGREEILSDIEARIAELFQAIKKQDNQVIGTDDVKGVIDTLGQPEDFAPDTEDDEGMPKSQATLRRKLFRDADDKYIGGVAAGLAHYFKIDPSWLRILWLVLFLFSGGTFLLIYLLFWVLVPEAQTTAEKLQMRGEPVNIATIEKKIKAEFEDLSSRVKEAIDYENNAQGLKKKSKILFSSLEKLFVGLFSFLGLIVGFVLALTAGIALLCTLIIFTATAIIGVSTFLPEQLLQYATQIDIPYWVFLTLVAIVLAVPFLFVLLLGIRLMAPKSKLLKGVFLLSLLGLWLIAILSIGVVALQEVKSHTFEVSTRNTQNLDFKATDTLYLSKGPDLSFKDRLLDNDAFDIISDNTDKEWIYTNEIQLHLKTSENAHASLRVEKQANGQNYTTAKKFAEAINYKYSVTDNRIQLTDYLISPAKNKFRAQEVDLTLFIPQGQSIFIDKAVADLLAFGIDNDQNWYRYQLAGHYWKMGADKLLCLDCTPGTENIP